MRSSEPGEVFCAEGARHTPVQQGLDQLGLEHAKFQTGWGRPIVR